MHLGLVDASGTLREKRLSAAAAERALRSGWSFIDAIDWWGPDDTVWRSGGSRSNRAIVDVESARPYPFGDDAAFFLADFAPPLRDLSPRARAQDLVKRATASGVEALLAWEFECLVLEPGTGSADPGDGGQPLLVRADHGVRGRAPVGAGRHARPRAACPSTTSAPSSVPAASRSPPPPRAPCARPTRPLLAKLYTKAYFARKGRRATFMAQLGPQFPGLGGHPSLSLRSTVDGAPVLCDEPGVLSKVGAAAVAGVIALLPELLALAAPYPNSYRRFGPGNWAPTTATWGVDNYSCALRVVADDPDVGAARAAYSRCRCQPAPLCGAVPRRRPVGHRRAARSSAAGAGAPGRPRPGRCHATAPGPRRGGRALRGQRGGTGSLRLRLRRALRRGPPGRGGGLPSLRLRRGARPLPGPGLSGDGTEHERSGALVDPDAVRVRAERRAG